MRGKPDLNRCLVARAPGRYFFQEHVNGHEIIGSPRSTTCCRDSVCAMATLGLAWRSAAGAAGRRAPGPRRQLCPGRCLRPDRPAGRRQGRCRHPRLVRRALRRRGAAGWQEHANESGHEIVGFFTSGGLRRSRAWHGHARGLVVVPRAGRRRPRPTRPSCSSRSTASRPAKEEKEQIQMEESGGGGSGSPTGRRRPTALAVVAKEELVVEQGLRAGRLMWGRWLVRDRIGGRAVGRRAAGRAGV